MQYWDTSYRMSFDIDDGRLLTLYPTVRSGVGHFHIDGDIFRLIKA